MSAGSTSRSSPGDETVRGVGARVGLGRVAAFVAVAGAYAVVTGASLASQFQLGMPAPFWPASGLGFGLLAMRPRSDWRWLVPAIFVGASLSDILFGYPFAQSLGLAGVNAIEPVVAVLVWQRIVGVERQQLRSAKDVLAMVASAGAGALVGAGLGVPILQTLVDAPFVGTFAHWAVDDFLGVIVVGPVVLAWWPGAPASSSRRSAESALIVALLVGVSLTALARAADLTGLALLYLTVPLLVWAALRTGPRGTSLACLTLSGVAVWATLSGAGPLAQVEIAERSMAIQFFLSLNLLPVYVLMGVVQSRDGLTETLATREAQYARILESTYEGVWEIDAQGITLYANTRMAEMLRRPVEEVLGRSIFELIHEDDRATLETSLAQLERTAEYELRLRTQDGGALEVSITADAMLDESGAYRGAVGLFRDVSERRREEERREALEAQLQQAQRLEAIGMLASGIAHDFNNLLTSILAYSDMLVSTLPEGTDEADFAAQILDAAERGSELTARVLAFSRKQVLSLQPLDLGVQVERSLAMARRLLGEQIEVDLTLPRDPVPVEADPGQVDQVLLNLLVNARDAMPDGGRIELTVDTVESHRFSGSGPELPVARLTVRDHGCGITPEDLAHIFDPFFTTKEAGIGTGLGLATSRGIIEQHGGHISARSVVDEGTTFEVLLPLRPELSPTQDRTRRELDRATLHARPGETLLLVEDDPQIFRMAHKILTDAGFLVLGRTSPAGAVQLMKESPTQLDLLVSDVVMPEMSGPQLYARLREAQPDLRALFVSGYPKDFLGAGGRVTESVELLLKPFTPVDLLQRVRQMLDAGKRVAPR